MENNIITNDEADAYLVNYYTNTEVYFIVSSQHTFVNKGGGIFISLIKSFKEKHVNQTLIWIIDTTNVWFNDTKSLKRYMNAQNMRSHFIAVNSFYGDRELFTWLCNNAVIVECSNITNNICKKLLLLKRISEWEEGLKFLYGQDLERIDEQNIAVKLSESLDCAGFVSVSPSCAIGLTLPSLGEPYLDIFKTVHEAARYKLGKSGDRSALSTIEPMGVTIYTIEAFIENY